MYKGQKSEFANFLADFFNRRYSKIISKLDFEEWFEDLEKYSFEQIKIAFKDYRQDVKNGDFPPKVSQILKLLKGKEIIKKYDAMCCFKESDIFCGNPGTIRVGQSDKELYFCDIHFELKRFKHDYEIEAIEFVKKYCKAYKIESPQEAIKLLYTAMGK